MQYCDQISNTQLRPCICGRLSKGISVTNVYIFVGHLFDQYCTPSPQITKYIAELDMDTRINEASEEDEEEDDDSDVLDDELGVQQVGHYHIFMDLSKGETA